jgi:hypothetical protein
VATAPHFCGLLPPPNRNDVVTAVQLTIGCIRRRWGHSAKDIARGLRQPNGESPDPETISRAERGETLPSFDLLAQIAFLYGDCADPLRRIMEPAPTGEPTTIEDRLALIEREAAAIRKEMAA